MECTPGITGFLNCYANLTIAIFTFGLFGATLALWIATRELVKKSDANAERQVRAYVCITNAQIDKTMAADGTPAFIVHVELKNAGQTPAYEFSTWLQPPQIMSPGEENFGLPKAEKDRSGHSILGPGMVVSIMQLISAGSERELSDRAKRIYLHGGAYYRDAFGRRRHFIFRSVSGDPTGLIQQDRSLSILRFPVQPHRLGYEAD